MKRQIVCEAFSKISWPWKKITEPHSHRDHPLTSHNTWAVLQSQVASHWSRTPLKFYPTLVSALQTSNHEAFWVSMAQPGPCSAQRKPQALLCFVSVTWAVSVSLHPPESYTALCQHYGCHSPSFTDRETKAEEVETLAQIHSQANS